jgi:ketose-bisphosphate aldolase
MILKWFLGSGVPLPVVSLEELLRPALSGGYAVAAFNVVDAAMMAGVVEAAEQAGSPVIVQAAVRAVRAFGPQLFKAMFDNLIERSGATAALHLDHCPDAGLAEECLAAGWNSALLDVSHLPYEQGLEATAKLVEVAAAYGGHIEGEFERIGRADQHTEQHTGEDGAGVRTEPLEGSVRFIRETGVACFSPDVGTLHGRYRTAPLLDLGRAAELARATGVPQVLHGASGLTDGQLRAFAGSGVAKVNFSTTLKDAYAEAVRSQAVGGALEPVELLGEVCARVRKPVAHYIGVLGSAGRLRCRG